MNDLDIQIKKIRPREGDLLFISAEHANEEDVNNIRNEIKKAKFGEKNIGCIFRLERYITSF